MFQKTTLSLDAGSLDFQETSSIPFSTCVSAVRDACWDFLASVVVSVPLHIYCKQLSSSFQDAYPLQVL